MLAKEDRRKVYAAPEKMQEKHFTDYGHSVQQNKNKKDVFYEDCEYVDNGYRQSFINTKSL